MLEIDVRKIEVAGVLFQDARSLVPRDTHFLSHAGPLLGLVRLELCRLNGRQIEVGRRGPHLVEHGKSELECLLAHDVGVAIVVHHHVEFVGAHHAVEPEIALRRTPSTRACKIAGYLEQHLDAFSIQEFLVSKNDVVVPDGVCHSDV